MATLALPHLSIQHTVRRETERIREVTAYFPPFSEKNTSFQGSGPQDRVGVYKMLTLNSGALTKVIQEH